MRKALFIVGLLLAALPTPARAGGESEVTAQPVFLDGAEAWRVIKTTCSTTPVLVSSANWKNDAGKTSWRSRVIINYSTVAAVSLTPDETYKTFTSSFGVVLGSATTVAPLGTLPISFSPSFQGAVWATWDAGCVNGGAGAGGYESYHKDIPVSER